MYGAILGDIIGSPFEFTAEYKTKDFELFTKGCTFTDDTVMTIAVGEALLEAGDGDEEIIKEKVIAKMKSYGRKYPYAGYGGRFRCWLMEDRTQPYNSYGNGSAMRVSSAGWLYDSLEKTKETARYTAEVTHNHPEGIRGAEAAACCIYLARMGKTKEEIKEYVEKEFGYNLNQTLDEIRPGFQMDETCQGTVPQSIIAFLEADGFEDAIRNAVSLGGDTDTLAAITGSIAEAYYGISEVLKTECKRRIPDEMIKVLEWFEMKQPE